MEKSAAGITHFRKTLLEHHRMLFAEFAQQQIPEVLFITCSDSRIDPNMITQTASEHYARVLENEARSSLEVKK